MDIIRNQDIEAGLRESGRVYLCGDLKRANGVLHIPTEAYEMGISVYPVFTFEKAHIHTFNIEYNFVLEGQIKIFLLNERKEILLKKGDLYAIKTNEPYVGKAMAGTKTLFSKVPGGNDKVLVPMDKALLHWGSSWDASYEEVV